MKKDVRNGFICWVGFFFTAIFAVLMIILNGGDLNISNEQTILVFGGGIISMLVIMLTMHLDKKVDKAENRVYR
jgi:predicted membrane channel-forming protein YqfA (hemolysin III family)